MTKELILFTARGCGPCKVMKPLLQEIAAERNLPLTTLEATPEPKVVEVFQKYKIKSIPAWVYVENGVEVDRTIGGQTLGQIEAKLAAWGF